MPEASSDEPVVSAGTHNLSCNRNPLMANVTHDLSQPFFITTSVILLFSSSSVAVGGVALRTSCHFSTFALTGCASEGGLSHNYLLNTLTHTLSMTSQSFTHPLSRPASRAVPMEELERFTLAVLTWPGSHRRTSIYSRTYSKCSFPRLSHSHVFGLWEKLGEPEEHKIFCLEAWHWERKLKN